MSGYLQRLVERTLGSEAVVQPLIAPRFASPPAMGEEFGELRLMHDAAPGGPTMVHRSTSAVEGVSTEQILPATGPVDELPRVEAARPPSGNESLSLASLQVQPGTENGEPTPHITLPAPTSTDVLAERMTEAEDATEEGSRREVQHISQIERSETDPSSAASAGIEALEADLEREPTAHPIIQSVRWEAAVVQSDEAQSQATARQAGDIDAGEPDRPRLGPDPSLPVANQLYEAELPSSSPTLPPIAESSLQAEIKPQPLIRVTIGRIEVRAVSPPVPAPRPSTPRPAPALSLQEYLEQRDGGKR
jgi:hypothetical protein